MSLAALLGLAGGAQGLSGGLQGMSQRFEARDEERKRTALQLLMAGWQPTPTAQGHPNAVGMLAHGNGAVDVLNDLKAPTSPVTRTGGDGYHVSQDVASSTPAQPDAATFAQPQTIDVPGMGSYSQTPQAALRSLLSIQEPLANIRHLNAETNALENPQPKPHDVTYSPADFTVNGQAVHGFATSTGEYVDANRQPVRGQVTPYRAPPQAAPKYGNFKRPDGQIVTVPMEEGVRQGWVEVPLAGTGGNAALGARGFGSGGVFGGASGLGSIREMHAALPNLEKFDLGLLSETPGSPTLKLFDIYRQNILNAGMHASGNHGAISSAIQAAMSAGTADELARLNPRLAEYSRNMAQWIVSDLNLTRNASDERARWDQLASSVLALPISDMPFANRRHYIQQIIEARRARLSGLDEVVPAAEAMLRNIAAQGGAPPSVAAPGGTTPGTRPPIADLIKP